MLRCSGRGCGCGVQTDRVQVLVHRVPVARPGTRADGPRGEVRAPAQVRRGRAGRAGGAGPVRSGRDPRLQPAAEPPLLREDHHHWSLILHFISYSIVICNLFR